MPKVFANFMSAGAAAPHLSTPIELICPVVTLGQLRTAVDNGADCIQLQFSERGQHGRLAGNINFKAMAGGIRYAHDRRCRVSVRIDTNSATASWAWWREAIGHAAALGVHAIELSDPALLFYVAAHYPHLELHYAAADTAIDFKAIALCQRQFKISRVALPRILSTAQLIDISQRSSVGLQLNGFCHFSSAIDSGRLQAAAVEKHAVKHRCAESEKDIHAALCAAKEKAANDNCFNTQNQGNIEVLRLLPQLHALGVHAICVETSASHPAPLALATRVWREAIDECTENISRYAVKPAWIADLKGAACR